MKLTNRPLLLLFGCCRNSRKIFFVCSRSILLAGIMVLIAWRFSQAASLTWDGGDATHNGTFGGTGTWDLNTTANWDNGAADVVWTDNSATGVDTAIFSGTAGTVTLNTNLSALGLQFTTTGYTISGTGVLTLGSGGISAGALTIGTTTIGNALSLVGGQSWTVGAGGTLAASGTITRNVGSTVDFSSAGTFNGAGLVGATSATTANGWATVGGTNWAINDGTNITALTNYASATATTSTAGGTTVANYTGKDVDVTNSPGALAGVVTINSLRFNTTAANTFTFATGVNTITSGGILVTSAVGNNLSTITGGTLQGAAGKDLVVIQNNTSNGLTIGSIIQNNTTATGLTKTGAGTLTLSGVNTYTGGTTINAGTLQITQTTSAAATGTFNLGGGTFQINQAGSNFGYSSTINLTADSTFSSIGAGAINWTGTLNGNSHVLNANSGATRVYLNGTFNNVTQINITAGAVGLDLASTGHESTPVVVSSGASLFVANATNTLASNITLNGGTGFGGTGALALESGANLTPVLSGTLTLNSGNSSIGNAGTANAGNNISITGKVTGTGSLTKISINRLTLSNATNDYNGSTTITGGVLQANDGVGLPTGSFLSLDGGVLQSNNSSASFTRSLGTSGGGNFQFTANGGGFSANGGQLTVNIGGATAGQTWGSTVGTNLVGTLQFGSVSANAKTLFQNAIDLNGGTRTINVTAGTGGDSAEISGNITNSTGTGALTFGVAGTGTLVLSGTNTFNGALTLTSGVLSVGATANLGGASADNNVTFNGGTLQVTGISMTSFGSHTLTYNASKTVGFDINNAANNFNAGATAFVSTDTLLKTGAGTLTLGAASNTIKILQLNQGTLDIGANNLTISNTGGTTINDASTSGTTTINATGGGKIVLSQNSTTDGPDIGAANGATLIINANITGTSSFESWTGTNNGTGVTVLNGTNDYTSDTLIHGGVLSVSSVGNQGSTTSNLGKGTTIHFGTSTVSSGVLLYTGAGETSNRVIDLQGTTAGGTIDASGSGLLKFTSNLTTTGNGAKTLTLQGSDSGEFAGNLINSSSATSITKAGAGTWTLSGANTYTGATTLSGGTLIAAANAGNTPVSTSSALSASTTVTLGVGTTLELLGNTTNTIFAPTSVVESGNGTFNFIAGNNGSGTGNTLILANMGQFGPASTAPTFNFSSLNGYNWQLGSGASGTGALNVFNSTAINSNTAGSTLSMPGGITINFAAAYTLTYGGAGNISSGTLVQNGAFASQWAYNGTGKLTLAAGYTFTGTSTIASGGTVQLGNGATAVTMSGGITNNGTLIYDPNAAFTSTAITGTGAVTIIGGQTVKKTTSLSTGLLTLGDSSTTGTLDLNGTAQTVGGLTNGSFTPASDSIVNTGVAAALTIDTTNGSQSFGGVISPATANLISLVKTGNNTQTFNGTTASTFTGGITVNGGTLALNEANVAGTNNLVSSSNALILGGGTLSVSGGTQTLASLATTANTTSFLTLGANSTLTITSATQSFGASSLLTLNTSAGGANGATVGNAIMVWNTGTAGSIINNAFLVTDAGGTGFATKNGSNQIIRLNTTLLPASGAVSATNYFIDNNTGGTAAAGSNTLTLSASEAANSISVDTTANSGTLDLGAGSFTLSNNNWSFAGANTYTINPGTGGNLKTVATGNAFVFDNVASGLVTINAPILAFGSNAVTFNGTGTTVLAGANTYTGTTIINAGTVKAGVNQIGTTSGALGAGTGALTLNSASILDLNGFNVGVGALTGNSGTTIANNGGSAATLTAGNGNGGVTFTGSVSAGTGGLSITKAGTGGLTFGSTTALGSNINITFTGNTGFGENNIGGTIGNSTNTFIVANGVSISNFTTSANAGWTLGANVSLGVGSTYGVNADQTVSQSGNFTSTDSTAVINWTYGFHSNSPAISGDNSGFLGTVNIGDNGQGGRDALRLNSLTAGSASAIWHFNGSAAWGGNGVRLNGGAGTYSMGEITSTGGAGQIFANTAGSILQLGDNTANVASYSGTIVNNGLSVTKVGTNTQILTGANTYTGATTVNGGELIVSGSLNGTLNVNVASAGTLASGATGSIATATAGDVAISGTLAPGDLGSVGTLTLAPGTGGKLNFLSGATFNFTISGATSDLVSFSTSGDWLGGSGNVALTLTGITAADYGNTYTVFHNVSTTGFVFSSITGYDTADYLANFTQVGGDYQLSFSAVPEPNMGVSLLGGVGLLLVLRRRGNHSRA